MPIGHAVAARSALPVAADRSRPGASVVGSVGGFGCRAGMTAPARPRSVARVMSAQSNESRHRRDAAVGHVEAAPHPELEADAAELDDVGPLGQHRPALRRDRVEVDLERDGGSVEAAERAAARSRGPSPRAARRSCRRCRRRRGRWRRRGRSRRGGRGSAAPPGWAWTLTHWSARLGCRGLRHRTSVGPPGAGSPPPYGSVPGGQPWMAGGAGS